MDSMRCHHMSFYKSSEEEDVEENIPQTSESLSEGDEDRTQMVDQETSSVDHDILKLNFGNKGGIFNKKWM